MGLTEICMKWAHREGHKGGLTERGTKGGLLRGAHKGVYRERHKGGTKEGFLKPMA